MIKLKTKTCTIHLPVNNVNEVAEIFCSDSKLKNRLATSYGLRGHILGKFCNIFDLTYALDSLSVSYWPTQGMAILNTPESALLEGEND